MTGVSCVFSKCANTLGCLVFPSPCNFFFYLSFALLFSRYLQNTKQVALWVLLGKKKNRSRIISTSIVIRVNDHLKWQKNTNDKFYINLTEFREIFHIFPHIVVSYSDYVFIKKQFWNTIFFSLLFFFARFHCAYKPKKLGRGLTLCLKLAFIWKPPHITCLTNLN